MENKFTAEQIEKIKECKNMEEIKELVQTENIELTDEQLEDITGGKNPSFAVDNSFLTLTCKNCGHNFSASDKDLGTNKCPNCGLDYTIKKSDPTYDSLSKY